MRRKQNPAPEKGSNDVEAALAVMGADELREVGRGLLNELDERAHSRLVSSLIHRAARGGSGWTPAALGDREVAGILASASAAERVGHADPSDVDEHLRRGSAAFLRKDYAAAHRIFGALLRPIGESEIDLGQHEMVDEVLGVDAGECAARYVVSSYMLSAPAQRVEAVRDAIEEVRSLGHFWEPIREMERVAVERLPGLDEFLPRWRNLVAQEAGGKRGDDWDGDQDRWLREVVQRLEGADGLGKVARSTRRTGDLVAWRRSLAEAGNWKSALRAFEDAAELVAEKKYARPGFLDGAALAAQELGRSDLPARLERAWRAGPNMLRLRRWLGSARSRAEISARAAEALDACPRQAHRQRAPLHVLVGDLQPAANLLAASAGPGWSGSEHPGHLLFPLFEAFLAGRRAPAAPGAGLPDTCEMEIEEIELMMADEDEPRLAEPEVDQIMERAGIDGIPDAGARSAVLAAMRKAAESRLAGVTGQKRRRHYGHAVELVAACVACDRSPEAARWVASIRPEHRGFPALRAELDRAPGSS